MSSEPENMKAFRNEIRKRFPEIEKPWPVEDGDDDNSPTVLMWDVVYWLKGLGQGGITREIEDRVVSFARWCESQPSGSSAEDDIYSQFIVGFFEDLFDSEVTRPLIPKLYKYDLLVENADYLKQWVGEDRYELALREYKKHGQPKSDKRRKR